MQIIPAIDIKDGKCVRLYKGSFENVTMYSSKPREVAERWESEGATLLHVVDLDGAAAGKPANLAAVDEIVNAINVPVQFGGGIRSEDSLVRLLDLGVHRGIIGSRALEDPGFLSSICEKYGDQVVVGVDANDGMVAIHGWVNTTKRTATEFAKEVQEAGGKRIIYTSIERDGTLEGPNVDRLAEVLSASDLPVVSSGGIGNIEHIEMLLPLAEQGLEGIIVGKAVYEGTVSLPKAIEVAATVFRS